MNDGGFKRVLEKELPKGACERSLTPIYPDDDEDYLWLESMVRCSCGQVMQPTSGIVSSWKFPIHFPPPPPPLPPMVTDPVDKHIPGTPKQRLAHTRKRAFRHLRYNGPTAGQEAFDTAYEVWQRSLKAHNKPFDSWVNTGCETGELYPGELE